MRCRRVSVGLGIALGVLIGCSDGNPIVHPGEQTALLQKAIGMGDAPAVVALYLEDAQVIPPDTGEPVKGRAAIQVLWQARMDAGLKAIVFSSGQRRGEDDSDTQFETGTYTSRNAAGEIDVGKYFTVWQLVDRTWLVSRHTWASDLEEASATGEPQAAPEADVAPEIPQPDVATE